MARLFAGQGFPQALHRIQVRAHMADVTAPERAAGERHHVPALIREPVDQGGPGNPAGPHHQGSLGSNGF